MNWIKVTDELPNADERVLVWIRYENETEFEWTESELDDPNSNSYIEPNSGRAWLMGSATNYEITHWAKVEAPRKMEIDRKLIQKMHDEYMKEYETNLKHDQDYRQMAKDQNTWQHLNARLYQGKWSALIHVINDLRYILELPEIGEDSNSYGYVFNVE